MNIIGCLRVRNEARWIERVIASILPLCDRVLVLDDHSTDQTATLCMGMPRTALFDSPFGGLSEARDKNYLLAMALEQRPDWILWIDGDEILTPESIAVIKQSLTTGARCLSFRVRYLWDREDQVRVDGVYGDFRRQSMFRPATGLRFEGEAPGFHCGNVPRALWSSCAYPDATLLHLGYMDRAERIRKYEWYRRNDPNNPREDTYRHIVQGDIPEVPADAKLLHGGPLRLVPLVSGATIAT